MSKRLHEYIHVGLTDEALLRCVRRHGATIARTADTEVGAHRGRLRVSEWYEPYALMLSEDAILVAGLIVSLSSIDFNLCLKGAWLNELTDEGRPPEIDYARFLNQLQNKDITAPQSDAAFEFAQSPYHAAGMASASASASASAAPLVPELSEVARLRAELASARAQQSYLEELVHARDRTIAEVRAQAIHADAEIGALRNALQAARESARKERVELERIVLELQEKLAQAMARAERERIRSVPHGSYEAITGIQWQRSVGAGDAPKPVYSVASEMRPTAAAGRDLDVLVRGDSADDDASDDAEDLDDDGVDAAEEEEDDVEHGVVDEGESVRRRP